jgi:DedD protein
MNDHNLDDLIIDSIQPTNSKVKSFLTSIALFIVVLIVGIILSKSYTDADTDSTLTFDDNSTSIIAPELKLQEPEEIATPKEEEKTLPTIIEEKSTQSKSLKEVAAPVPMIETIQEPSTPIETPTVSIKKTTPIVEIKKPVKKVPIPHQVESKKSVITHKPKRVITSNKYYVQVGSFKQNPSPRFLSVIKSSGFKYHVSKPDNIGNKKLLIGPYKTRADVDKALVVVRDRIHKSAFVVQK